MATDAESRKLHNLRVIELRNELGKRNLDKTGVKNELIERLQKALIDEGHNPEEYLFDVESADKKSRGNKRRTTGEGDAEKEDAGNDSSLVVEEELKDKDQSDEIKEESTSGSKEDVQIVTEESSCKDEAESSTEEVKESVEIIDVSSPSVEKKETVNDTVGKSNKNENTVLPKEQRTSVAKKSILEETKEKANDTNKEDNEDSINLTIGEDEVKLFGEEDDSTHEKEVKEESKENTNLGTEKETKNENTSKSESEVKEDLKITSKKVVLTKNNGNSRNLWVSGLSSLTRATDLKTLFSKYGKVVGAKIVTNAKTPGSRCYGYVTMLSADDAIVSMQNLNKTELDGRMITVERAKDDGTGPARPKNIKKEPEKKKIEQKDEKKIEESKKKTAVVRNDIETKVEEKRAKEKEEKKSTSVKDKNEDINGETKTLSIKSDKISGNKERSKRSRSSKEGSRHKSKENGRPRSNVLTFQQIKEERERHRLKEKERALRMEERRRQIERERQREIERRQREEAMRLKEERMKLKLEREKIEREKAELLKLEREQQRLERERLQREKEEIRRAQLKLEETRRAVKRPIEMPRSFEDDRKRRPPSPDRRHVHVTSSSSTRKEPPSRANTNRRASPAEYVSRRAYDNSVIESSRKEQTSHSSRDKSGKESSRYDHHYQSSHGSDDVRSKDMRHRYPDPPKSSNKDSGRYDRGPPSGEGWSRSSGNISSSVKPFSSINAGGSSSMSSRDTHAWSSNSSDRKTDSQPPWVRTSSSSNSDRWQNSSGSASGIGMRGTGPLSGSSGMFSGSGSYSDSIPSMGMMLSSGPSYSDRFDAYKSNIRKY